MPGAVFAGAIAALIFVGVMLNEDYRPAIIAIAVVYVVALVGFAVFGRHRLVLSPEEEYAMSGGLHGDPQAEGYGAIDVEDIDPEARAEDEVTTGVEGLGRCADEHHDRACAGRGRPRPAPARCRWSPTGR